MKLEAFNITTLRKGSDGYWLSNTESELALLKHCGELHMKNTELRGKLDGSRHVVDSHVRYAEWCFWAFVVTGSCLVGSWAAYGLYWLIDR